MTDAAAVGLVLSAAIRGPVRLADLGRFAILAALSMGYGAICRRIQRTWYLLSVSPDRLYVDFLSVWTLAAALVLPFSLAASLVLLVYVHAWFSAPAPRSGRLAPHKYVYTVAAMVLTVRCVAAVAGPLGGHSGFGAVVLTLAAAIALYLLVDTCIIAAAIQLSTGTWKLSTLLGSRSENALELATLALGAVTAVSVVYAPWGAVLVLPALFLLQHQALLRQLVAAATTDVKTDLLNAGAWRQIAQREVARVSQRGGSVAILVLDMDHFKRINDQHGHLGGDAALKAVGATLADELRGYDAVGRFGGEEFVAVLPDTGLGGAEHAAERLRRRIEELAVSVPGSTETITITASIGIALCPEHGDSLDHVLAAADDAMYQAKRTGRNSVHTATSAAWLYTAAS